VRSAFSETVPDSHFPGKSFPGRDVGKTTLTEQPGYFVYGRGRWQGKKGRKNFWGGVCGKWGIVLFGVKSITAKVIKTCFHAVTLAVVAYLPIYLSIYVLPNANVSMTTT